MIRQADPSEAHDAWRIDGYDIALLRGITPQRNRAERLLLDAGLPLPLPHRIAWATLQPRGHENWLLFVRDAAGRPCGAAAVDVAPSRALSGHRLLRVERFGPGLPAAAHRAALQVLVSIARRERRVLRLYVESFAVDDAQRASLEAGIAAMGFAQMPAPRCYQHTLLLDLDADEESIFASFHRSGRQNIRTARKHPVRIAPIVDPAQFARLDEIAAETFTRTGGRYQVVDWTRIATISEREPGSSRLVGLFRTDCAGPDALLAFAWACAHGDHAHYSSAGSTRQVDRRIPLLYPLIWDLICWAKRGGARYFDLGGVTPGSSDTDDPLGGISDFKRCFSGRAAQVGGEWSYEPRPMQANAARMVKSASLLLSRVLARP